VNVSYRWLKAVAPDLSLSAEEVAELLAERGAPVEELLDLGQGLVDVVVARVEESGPHPNADRLSLCTVNAGGELLQVVCGAPNVKAGAYYPFAPVGATLPGGLKLKKAKIRGEYSNGMLCSAIELGLGTDHDGIMELAGEPEIGIPLVEALGLDDWRLDVEVTANRGDLLSHVGIAREVAPSGQESIRLPEIPDGEALELSYERDPSAVAGSGVAIQIDDADLCPRYIGVVIRGVTIGPSPEWLQARLRAVGGRPINNVVDATNYVLLELGQPMHAFDLERLGGAAVVVRRARAGESVTTLDGLERSLTSDMLAICDAEVPVAIAGLMGGRDSEVSDSTTDILLECALFEPASIRATRRALGMSTDASYRYERGVDPNAMERAAARCVQVILATAGGVVDGRALDVHAKTAPPVRLDLRPSRVLQVLGIAFDRDRIIELLVPLGFEVGELGADGAMEIVVPDWRRHDVRREIDVIEEIARTHGYDNFPEELAPFRPTTVPDHPLFALEEDLRTWLIHRGAYELQTPSFTAVGEVELPNPVSTTESHLRASMIHGVLGGVAYNLARGVRDLTMFEIGTVFFAPATPGAKPSEATHLGLAMVGRPESPHWSGNGNRSVDLWDAKGWFAELVTRVWPSAVIQPGEGAQNPSWLGDGAGIEALNEGRRVGVAGPVHALAIDTPPWAGSVFAMEVELPAVPEAALTPIYSPIGQFPGIDRDLALVVPAGVTAGQVRAAIEAKAGALAERIELFDLYEGEGIDAGARSLAYRITFRSVERTLKDSDVEPAVLRVLKCLKEELNVHQRG